MAEAGLWFLVMAALGAPFLFRKVEERIELFLLAVGALAVTIAGRWSEDLVRTALTGPIPISMGVMGFGLVFSRGRFVVDRMLRWVIHRVPARVFHGALVAMLGLLSSITTAIVASILLVEIIRVSRPARRKAVRLTVISCFSIGMGAVLTPIGEPLAAVATLALKGDSWLLFRTLAWFIVPGIIVLSILGASLAGGRRRDPGSGRGHAEPLYEIAARAAGVYAFVSGLILLGEGIADLFASRVLGMPAAALYWVNMISAALDNATLAAVELGPHIAGSRLSSLLLSLVISGGMLIPGNIPNIIAARHMRISSREWAKFGVPLGLALLAAYFLVWLAVAAA